MAKKIKPTILFDYPVESINRKMALRKDTCSDKNYGNAIIVAPKPWMGACTRERFYAGAGVVKTNFMVVRKNARSTPPSSEELVARSNFTAVRAWVRDANRDMSAITVNQQKWFAAKADFSKRIQGVSANGRSYYSWMFKIAYEIFVDTQELPANHRLPDFDA